MNKKGSILMITLWILAILAVFVVGLGYRASVNLTLAKYQRNSLKAYYLAKAGINQAIISAKPDNPLKKSWDDGGYFECALSYEEGKLNINGHSDFDRDKLSLLLDLEQVEDAAELTNTIMDWMNPVTKIEIAKKEPLKRPEELLLILEYFYQSKGISDYRNKAREIFAKVKDYITVYGDNRINLNTAPLRVLEAIFRTATKEMIDSGEADKTIEGAIPNLLSAIDGYRQGAEKAGIEPFSSTDINQETIKKALGLAGQVNDQTKIIDRSVTYFTAASDNLRIGAKGGFRNTTKRISVVYDRATRNIVYWHQN
jgi:hypothetical protein